ncbi:iron-containing redox enzyme family protein, partial [Lonsdalea britannica]|uniref:iron-containing redox enzyme family protein n=1 Tax=Lonsdalea britannica TaxID=1082704 RepID=UPI00111C3206
MIIDLFSKIYILFNAIERDGTKTLLSKMLLDKLDLYITNKPPPNPCPINSHETLQILATAFHGREQIQEKTVGTHTNFRRFDLYSASFAVSRCFDARVSHTPSSCDYFILYEQLRKSAQAECGLHPLSKEINEAAKDVTQFDDAFVIPTMRLAVAYMTSSVEKDALILADLILVYFNTFSDFSKCYQTSEGFCSAADIHDSTQSTDDNIRNIIAFMAHKLLEQNYGIYTLQKMLIKLSDIRQALLNNLAALSLKNRDHSITVEKIIASKSVMAYGYHHTKKLNNCPFDKLMKSNPRAFTHHLKKSVWFRGKAPEKMPFFSQLTAFEGPMYKVFNDQELLVIKHWATVEQPTPKSATGDIANTSLSPPITLPQHEQQYRQETNIRSLFHQLMTSDDHDYLDWQGEKFTDAWLARARKKISKIPFKSYSNDSLDNWFLAKAKTQAADYSQGRIVSNKSKQEVIDEAVHLAPMILLDGAWINHYSYPHLIDDEIGTILFDIYADEIGNGHIEKNHPVIYRDLIYDMGIELLDISSEAFSSSEYFDDDDFLVPVFWLSISRFPKKYLPETLGLNLAMELAGVGGAYKQAHDELKQYGFNTSFVDLHNTIDN